VRFVRPPDQLDRLRVAAAIHHDHRRPPDEIWLEVDKRLLESVILCGDLRLPTTLPLAFGRGESLTMKSPVDPTLLGNLR
jgi:hypothetical protein